MTTKRLIPLALAGALLSPVFSLGLGVDVASAKCTYKVPQLIIPRYAAKNPGLKHTKQYGIRDYVPGSALPQILEYGLGRDKTSKPIGSSIQSGNILIGGHSSNRIYANQQSFFRFGLKKSTTWLKSRKLPTTGLISARQPAPFAYLGNLKAGDPIIIIDTACRKHTFKVLGGSFETIRPNQSSYAFSLPRNAPGKMRADQLYAANGPLLRSTGITSGNALSSNAKMLTLYGCFKVGTNPTALRKIVRAVWVSTGR